MAKNKKLFSGGDLIKKTEKKVAAACEEKTKFDPEQYFKNKLEYLMEYFETKFDKDPNLSYEEQVYFLKIEISNFHNGMKRLKIDEKKFVAENPEIWQKFTEIEKRFFEKKIKKFSKNFTKK